MPRVNFHDAVLAFAERPVKLVEKLEVGVKLDSLGLKFPRVLADMSDLRLGVGAPREKHLSVVLLL